jgi:hypothetical protein
MNVCGHCFVMSTALLHAIPHRKHDHKDPASQLCQKVVYNATFPLIMNMNYIDLLTFQDLIMYIDSTVIS